MPRLKKKWMQPVVKTAPTPAVPVSIVPGFLNVKQASDYFGVTTWSVRRLISTGKLRSKLFGKRLLIKRADIDALWESEPAYTGKKRAA